MPDEATPALMAPQNQSAGPRPSIPESRLPDDAPGSHADGAPQRPRMRERTTGHGNRRQSLDPGVPRPAAAPTVRAGYSARRASGPAGTRPRDAHREPS